MSMKFGKTGMYVVAVVLLVASFACTYFQRQISMDIEVVKILNTDGTVSSSHTISTPLPSFVLEWVSRALFSIALAIFIALAISSRITAANQAQKEEELKQKTEEVHRNVFSAVFGNLIPNELFSVIKSEIFENRLVVYGAVWDFTFSFSKRNPEHLSMSFLLKYNIHNHGQSDYQDTMKFITVNSPESNLSLAKANCTIDLKTHFVFDAGSPESIQGVLIEENYENDPEKKLITLPLFVPAGKNVELVLVFHGEYGDSVSDFYYGKHPIINGSMRFQYPEGYEMRLSPSISAKLNKEVETSTTQLWKLNGCLLPRQGFNYSLRKRA